MDLIEEAKKAFGNAYSKNIATLYESLGNDIAVAMVENNQSAINAAREKFKKELEIAKRIYQEAMAAV